MWLNIAVAFIVLTILVIASFVLSRSSRSLINRAFGYFSLMTAVWISANYIGANFKAHGFSKFFIHGDLFSGTILALSFWYLSLSLLNKAAATSRYGNQQRKYFRQVSTFTALVGLSTFLPAVLKVTKSLDKLTVIHYGSGFVVYSAVLLILLVSGIVNILITLHRAKGKFRRQIGAMVSGLTLAVALVAIPNLLLPLFNSSANVNLLIGNLAYVGIVIFISSTFYSIVVHKLFDLRLIVARTLAYSLSISTFILVYIAMTLLLSSFLFKDNHVTSDQLVITTIMMIFVVITINPVRRFFDRRTNRLFYRDAYDTQSFLDTFNKVLVSNYELMALLHKSLDAIVNNLKPNYAIFGISESENVARKIVGTPGYPSYDEQAINYMRKTVSKMRSKVIVSDMLDERHSELREVLEANNIGVIIRLAASHANDQGIGYLVLGTKKSGNPYSKQDVQVMEILASELVLAIQNSLRFEEIENFNTTLQAKVTAATRKLRATNEKLRELDEAKDDFVSMASHQLRTPLTSIKGYTSMVLEGDAGKINATQRRLLEQSFTSSQRMVYLIADLLNVSRLKTGKFIIEPATVNLADLVQQEIGQLKEVAASRSLTLTYEAPVSFPSLLLDETKTRQVIMNFVDNAIYYTPSGGHISVQLVETPASVELRVVDDGIGVPKSEQPHLFTKFYRAGNARKARPDGTGLGLFMAKKVVVAEGGAIIFQTQEGKGSTFGFVFSKSKLAPQPITATADTKQVEISVKA